jgi:hypothetical protein
MHGPIVPEDVVFPQGVEPPKPTIPDPRVEGASFNLVERVLEFVQGREVVEIDQSASARVSASTKAGFASVAAEFS